MIKTTGKEKNYELIEYILNVNTQYTQVLMELNENDAMDAAYTYGVSRLTEDRFTGESNFYLYDPAGNVAGITDQDGYLWQSYRYDAFGNATFGSPQYDNEYTFNGESYNPNIHSQYLRARYYDTVKGSFLTEDSYLGDIWNPLTLNRYSYCIGNPLFYDDPSGHAITDYKATDNVKKQIREDFLHDMPSGGIEGYEFYRQYNERISFYENLNLNGHWDYPWYKNEEQRISYIVNYDFNSTSGKAYVETCMQRAKIMEKAKRCEEAISKIDGYLEGNVGEEEARKYIEELAKEGAFYGGKSIKSVKSYKSDDKDKDYDQFDTLIIGWVAYYNKKNPDYSINPEWVKAMIYEESRYSYVYSKSPNANASKDIMQTLDPRNPTIFGYVNVDIDKTMVAGAAYKGKEPERWVTVNELRDDNGEGPILQKNVGGDIIPIAQTLFSKEGDKYYYKYSNATPFMSLGIGINTLQEKYKLLGTSSTPDDIMAAYNVGNDYYVEKINYLLDLEVHSGWENEYDEKFKK